MPWEHAACGSLPTGAEKASYDQWIDAFAAGIGSSRVALILQPDLPFAMCVPHHSRVPLQMVAYAAQKFGSLPHTSVYIDAGAADWPTVSQARALLLAAGVRYARGFALDATHYDSTQHEILFGARVAGALARSGVPGRHFVINTASTAGRSPISSTTGPTSTTRRSARAPLAAVRDAGHPAHGERRQPALGTVRTARSFAARFVDAYLWIGRPWLDDQSDPFDLQRALALARTTPF